MRYSSGMRYAALLAPFVLAGAGVPAQTLHFTSKCVIWMASPHAL